VRVEGLRILAEGHPERLNACGPRVSPRHPLGGGCMSQELLRVSRCLSVDGQLESAHNQLGS
jgi:hypothetical protein